MTKLDDEAVLLDLESGAYFGLNHVGLAILEALNEGLDQDAAITRLAQDFDVPPDILERDVGALISELSERKLIFAI